MAQHPLPDLIERYSQVLGSHAKQLDERAGLISAELLAAADLGADPVSLLTFGGRRDPPFAQLEALVGGWKDRQVEYGARRVALAGVLESRVGSGLDRSRSEAMLAAYQRELGQERCRKLRGRADELAPRIAQQSREWQRGKATELRSPFDPSDPLAQRVAGWHARFAEAAAREVAEYRLLYGEGVRHQPDRASRRGKTREHGGLYDQVRGLTRIAQGRSPDQLQEQDRNITRTMKPELVELADEVSWLVETRSIVVGARDARLREASDLTARGQALDAGLERETLLGRAHDVRREAAAARPTLTELDRRFAGIEAQRSSEELTRLARRCAVDRVMQEQGLEPEGVAADRAIGEGLEVA
ncbi:MAG: hypothetical protein ACRDNK_23950 [Solirubrobacteraceae bacterium]